MYCTLRHLSIQSCKLGIESSVSESWSEMIPDEAHSLKTAVHMAAERGYDDSLRILIE